MHYQRWRRHGDPLVTLLDRNPSLADRFWAKVDKGDGSGCWLWTASVTTGGYGFFSVKGRLRAAHRVGWELQAGPIPEGLVMDHLCRNRRCIRAAHLQPVLQVENVARRDQANFLPVSLAAPLSEGDVDRIARRVAEILIDKGYVARGE